MRDQQGMPQLQGNEFHVTPKGPYTFEIDADTSDADTFVSGYVNQVKQPCTVSFRPLKAALEDPGQFMETDFAKIGRPGVLHQVRRHI